MKKAKIVRVTAYVPEGLKIQFDRCIEGERYGAYSRVMLHGMSTVVRTKKLPAWPKQV